VIKALKEAGINRKAFFHPWVTGNLQSILNVLPLCRFFTIKPSEPTARAVGFGADDSYEMFEKPSAEFNN